MREQNPRCGAGFVSRILIDDRVDQAAQQESARAGGQFMRDPNDVLRPPECLKRRRNALVAGTCIVEPDQIGMFVEEDRTWLNPKCRSA